MSNVSQTTTAWVRDISVDYGVPEFVFGGWDVAADSKLIGGRLYVSPAKAFSVWQSDVDDLYERMRTLCSAEYSARVGAVRSAARRSEWDAYIPPGNNFLVGATADERELDLRSRRTSEYASRSHNAARREMSEYDRWTEYKYILAIITGRYGHNVEVYAADTPDIVAAKTAVRP